MKSVGKRVRRAVVVVVEEEEEEEERVWRACILRAIRAQGICGARGRACCRGRRSHWRRKRMRRKARPLELWMVDASYGNS